MMSNDHPIPPMGPPGLESLDSRLWLELASAGLAGLAAMSPSAREAIDVRLQDSIRGRAGNDPLVGLLNWLRLEMASDPAELRLSHRLAEAILAKADSLPDQEDQPRYCRAGC